MEIRGEIKKLLIKELKDCTPDDAICTTHLVRASEGGAHGAISMHRTILKILAKRRQQDSNHYHEEKRKEATSRHAWLPTSLVIESQVPISPA